MERLDAKDLEAKWYVLHTYSGYEQVAKTNLEMVIKKYHLEDRIFDIFGTSTSTCGISSFS